MIAENSRHVIDLTREKNFFHWLGRHKVSGYGEYKDQQRRTFVFRDAIEPNWQRGLKQTAAVVCDFLTAAELPEGCKAIPFSLLSETSIAELRRYEAFIRQPIEI